MNKFIFHSFKHVISKKIKILIFKKMLWFLNVNDFYLNRFIKLILITHFTQLEFKVHSIVLYINNHCALFKFYEINKIKSWKSKLIYLFLILN